MPDVRRRVPPVDALLRSAPGRRAAERFGRDVVRGAIRAVVEEVRGAAARGREPPEEEIILARAVNLAARMALGLSPVINATGVVLHTNLGRAPLPEQAARAAARVGRSYSDLEVERETGKRGRRTTRAEFLLTAITRAEDALVVNNNAAALLLALAALSRRKDVLVSRGELIEIGGEFRLPEIMAASGARLVEVGTTNRTRLADYRRAVSDRTGMILKVHPSNYRIVGFAESPDAGGLAELAHRAGVPLLHDIGSGLLGSARMVPGEEPAASDALAAGADLVCFSGDKLLGGPQAGILLGRRDLVDRLRRHPIARAVRVDKMTVAALEVVLRMHADGRRDELPAWRSLVAPPASVRARARAVAEALDGAEVRRTESVAGGGSLPGYGIPSHAVTLRVPRPERVAARLRTGSPPVFCRVEDDALVFDLRTVDPAEDAKLLRAVRYALSQEI
ncbi:MAG TPA: L-seryl-tRNA(Sec) selenium transferase [Actinomycetota bacterium]|jgi:L-seryl-tRNA(Ser) seleniumtransferase|nr:L-seryl-tRNA(Sec) selenium transferase [Actinomycetota bacterium]